MDFNYKAVNKTAIDAKQSLDYYYNHNNELELCFKGRIKELAHVAKGFFGKMEFDSYENEQYCYKITYPPYQRDMVRIAYNSGIINQDQECAIRYAIDYQDAANESLKTAKAIPGSNPINQSSPVRHAPQKSLPVSPGPQLNAPAPMAAQVQALVPQIIEDTDNKFKVKYGNVELEICVEKDLCDFNADAIVNAANVRLQAGSGVCGAIHQKGGDSIFKECAAYLKAQQIAQVEEGSAIVTEAGRLKHKCVIHAVGPKWKGTTQDAAQSDREKLYSAYSNSLEVAKTYDLESIVFPSLSTGIFGFPLDQAASIAAKAMKDFAEKEQGASLKKISLALWPANFAEYKNALKSTIGQ